MSRRHGTACRKPGPVPGGGSRPAGCSPLRPLVAFIQQRIRHVYRRQRPAPLAEPRGEALLPAAVQTTSTVLNSSNFSPTQMGSFGTRSSSDPHRPPQGEQGRPDQLFRRGLGRSGSVAPADSRLPVRSSSAAELTATFCDQQSQHSDLPFPRATNTANRCKHAGGCRCCRHRRRPERPDPAPQVSNLAAPSWLTSWH
jgi:hypothetical protein